MEETELEEIRRLAHRIQKQGKAWHFHVLTPQCVFNEKNRYAFILECPDDKKQLVHYSDRAERALGEELAPLIHGVKILQKDGKESAHKPSPEMQKIIDRAQELNDKNIEWHHHVLSPSCMYSTNHQKFTFVFEDPESQNVTTNLTDTEPTDDLKYIERLFYRK